MGSGSRSPWISSLPQAWLPADAVHAYLRMTGPPSGGCPGLELAVEDHSLMTIASLDQDSDLRRVQLNVAGVAALLVAKAYKISDRAISGRHRLSDKDAADIYRLISTADADTVAGTFHRLLSHPRVADTTRTGLGLLHEQFGAARTIGVDMAARALGGSVPDSQVRMVAPAFIRELPRP
jgi:hypothetical protein